VDDSVFQLAVTQSYGGSDIASPSFNRPRYVRYTSVHEPRDLGQIYSAGFDLEGVVGAESGSQTLFFFFRALQPSRIGLRRVLLNRYTDQYISITLNNEAGPVPIGIDGFGNSSVLTPRDLESAVLLSLDLGYVACDYWVTGYCEDDCAKSSAVVTESGGTGVSDPSAEFTSPFAAIMPAGLYRIVISNSQWPQLPYRFQISISPPGDLFGVCELLDESYARIGLAKLEGKAEMRAIPDGRLFQQGELSGAATMQATPSGTITRTSPYGP
jgi:hypothetical protein